MELRFWIKEVSVIQNSVEVENTAIKNFLIIKNKINRIIVAGVDYSVIDKQIDVTDGLVFSWIFVKK